MKRIEQLRLTTLDILPSSSGEGKKGKLEKKGRRQAPPIVIEGSKVNGTKLLRLYTTIFLLLSAMVVVFNVFAKTFHI